MNKKSLRILEDLIAEEIKKFKKHNGCIECLKEEDDQKNIEDLEKLLANPDPKRAKDYGSVDKYKEMLRNKIASLKKKLKEVVNEVLSEQSMFDKVDTMSLNQFVQQSLEEADLFGGISTTTVPPEEMSAYLDRSAGVPKVKKSGEPVLNKSGNPMYTTSKSKTDKYKYPYIHGVAAREIQIVDGSNRSYDLNKLKAMITERPSVILKQNEKITHSGGKAKVFFNIGLPALTGLVVDERTGEFKIVNTCPGAGACKVYCYARKGGYVQWVESSLSQTKLLNFLLNDPEGFQSKLVSEIKSVYEKYKKQNVEVDIRWHDSGDFFSPEYLQIAYNIANVFPEVTFYAYTKMAGVATGDKPNNFKMNFSMGATPEQEKQVALTKDIPKAVVIPKPMFDDLIVKNKKGRPVKIDGELQFKSPEDLLTLKRKLANKHGVPIDSVLTYKELIAKPETDKPIYNVIVKPGDGDDAAARKDVLGTWLLIH